MNDQIAAEPDSSVPVDSSGLPSGDKARWVLAGGTAVGTTHAAAERPCQDSAAWWAGPPGGASHITAVAVIADGAGSADLSEIGSQTAVAEIIRLTQCLAGAAQPADDDQRNVLTLAAEEVTHMLREHQAWPIAKAEADDEFAHSTGDQPPEVGTKTDACNDTRHQMADGKPGHDRDEQVHIAQQAGVTVSGICRCGSEGEVEAIALVRALFAGARRAVEIAAQEVRAEVSHLATTLIVALATDAALVVGEIGDGVVAVRASGAVTGPLAPQRGEFANETTFITTGEHLPEISLASFPTAEVDAFGLSSDGMRLLITSNLVTGTPHTPFFEDMFSGVASGVSSEAITRYLSSADDRTGDDKSLVIGVRVS